MSSQQIPQIRLLDFFISRIFIILFRDRDTNYDYIEARNNEFVSQRLTSECRTHAPRVKLRRGPGPEERGDERAPSACTRSGKEKKGNTHGWYMDILKYANARRPLSGISRGHFARKIRRSDSGVGRRRDREDFPVRKTSVREATHVRLRATVDTQRDGCISVYVACVQRRLRCFHAVAGYGRVSLSLAPLSLCLSSSHSVFLFSSPLVTPYFPPLALHLHARSKFLLFFAENPGWERGNVGELSRLRLLAQSA